MKRYVLPVLLLVLATVGYFVASELLSYRSVTFSLDPDVKSVNIHSGGDSDETTDSLKTITSSDTSVRLKEGEYYYVPSGDAVSDAQILFTVTGDLAVTVKPDYSADKLASLATTESSAILAALTQKHPTAIKGFEINNLALYQRGDWAGAVLSPTGMDINNPEGYYRAILHKVDNQWQVIGKPQLVLTLDNTSGVSRELLTSVNALSLR